ncbi:hypothetical protein MASR1M65_11570 [Saprospiraceae bacterium]
MPKRPDEKVVYVDLLTAGDRAGISKITIHAKGNGETAYQEIEVDIRNRKPVTDNACVLGSTEWKNS